MRKPSINPEYIPVTDENVEFARAFLLRVWKQRWRERQAWSGAAEADWDWASEPRDLSRSCIFSSMFSRAVFGGRVEGSRLHQFVVLQSGRVLDLNAHAEDVARISSPYVVEPGYIVSPDIVAKMKSCQPRVDSWLHLFREELKC